MRKGPYKVLESKKIYQNPWIDVFEDRVLRPDGKEGIFGVVNYLSGVHIMAVDTEGNVILIREYMYAIEKEDIMFPAGGIDKGETPIKAAKRELLEEIGYESNEWVELGIVNPLTMIVKAPYFLFLAKNCKKVGNKEATIEIVKSPISEVEKQIENGEITLAGSVCAFYMSKKYFEVK
jgi:hypothetical protein